MTWVNILSFEAHIEFLVVSLISEDILGLEVVLSYFLKVSKAFWFDPFEFLTSLTVTNQILSQGDLELDFRRFHWVWNIKISMIGYMICVYEVLMQGEGLIGDLVVFQNLVLMQLFYSSRLRRDASRSRCLLPQFFMFASIVVAVVMFCPLCTSRS